jgi:hypothetical protein
VGKIDTISDYLVKLSSASTMESGIVTRAPLYFLAWGGSELLPSSAGGKRVSASTTPTTGTAILTVGSAFWIVVADGARGFGATEISRTGAEQLRLSKSSSLKSRDTTRMPSSKLILSLSIGELTAIQFAE